MPKQILISFRNDFEIALYDKWKETLSNDWGSIKSRVLWLIKRDVEEHENDKNLKSKFIEEHNTEIQ